MRLKMKARILLAPSVIAPLGTLSISVCSAAQCPCPWSRSGRSTTPASRSPCS